MKFEEREEGKGRIFELGLLTKVCSATVVARELKKRK